MKGRKSGGGSATRERAQGKPPGATGVNKPVPAGRDMRRTAPQTTAKTKTNQRNARP